MLEVMLIAPEAEELAIIAVVLQRVGCNVLRSVNLDKAIGRWGSTPLDLIVVCYEGPVLLEQVNRLRGMTAVPLVVIGEQITEAHHVALLDAGADLVIERPFGARLLRAQTRALLRRASGMPLATLPTLTVGAVSLDPVSRSAAVQSRSTVRLTQLEFRLMYTLMMHAGQILSPQQLVERVWGYDDEKDRDLVRGLVRRLRMKIEPDPKCPVYLVTRQGVGYVFESGAGGGLNLQRIPAGEPPE